MKRVIDAPEGIGLGYEDGWAGAFTRQHTEGCFPNGSRIIKVAEDPGGDFTPLGSLGTVLGSISHQGEACYFVEWDRTPKTAITVVAPKIAKVAKTDG